MRFTFTFNGISNEDMGVIVPNRPPLSSPRRRMQFSNVDGKYGSTSFDMGHEVYTTEFEIVVDSEDVMDSVLAWLRGPGKFTRSDRPGMYQNVYIKDDLHFAYIADHGDNRLYRGTLKLLALDVYWYRDGWFKPWGANLIKGKWTNATPYYFGNKVGKTVKEVFREDYTENLIYKPTGSEIWLHSNNGNVYPIEAEDGDGYRKIRRRPVAGEESITDSRLSTYTTFFIEGTTPEDILTISVEVNPEEDMYLHLRGGDSFLCKGGEWTTLRVTESASEDRTRVYGFYNSQSLSPITDDFNPWIKYRNFKAEYGDNPQPYWTPHRRDIEGGRVDEDRLVVDEYEKGYYRAEEIGTNKYEIEALIKDSGINLFVHVTGSSLPIGEDISVEYTYRNKGPAVRTTYNRSDIRSTELKGGSSGKVIVTGSTVSEAGVQFGISRATGPNASMYTNLEIEGPYMFKGHIPDRGTSWEVDSTPRIVNEGTAVARPIIKLTKNKDSKAIVKIGSKTLEYNFPKEENEVYIDTKELKVYNSKGERRDIYFSTFEFPELPPGPTVVDNRSDVEVEFKHKDAWL